MYIIKQPHKCIKCDHEFDYSPDDPWETPVLTQEEETSRGTVVHSMPVCPKCWETFLKANFGLGCCTIDWGYGGSHYSKVKNASTSD